jgi:hypothetical protein
MSSLSEDSVLLHSGWTQSTGKHCSLRPLSIVVLIVPAPDAWAAEGLGLGASGVTQQAVRAKALPA